jgi:hypothetical protein
MSAPSAPTSPIATAGYGMAMVTWSPPEGDVTSYTATATGGDDPISITVTVPTGGVRPPLQAIFGGLENDTEYTFTVIATNSDGSSAPSAASNAVTPTTLPGQMMNLLTAIIGQLALDFDTFDLGNVPECRIGAQFVAEQSDGPRIVFVPKSGDWTGSWQLGTGRAATDPRQLWTRPLLVEAHIWGVQLDTTDAEQATWANYGVAEQILTRLAATVRRVADGANPRLSEQWIDSNADNLARGAVVILRMVLQFPSADYQPPLATLDALPQTMAIVASS